MGGWTVSAELPLASAGAEESKVSHPEWISVSMPYVTPRSRGGGDAWAAEAAAAGWARHPEPVGGDGGVADG